MQLEVRPVVLSICQSYHAVLVADTLLRMAGIFFRLHSHETTLNVVCLGVELLQNRSADSLSAGEAAVAEQPFQS